MAEHVQRFELLFTQYENGTWSIELPSGGAFYAASPAEGALLALQAFGIDKMAGYVAQLRAKVDQLEADLALQVADYDGLLDFVEDLRICITQALRHAGDDAAMRESIQEMRKLVEPWPTRRTSRLN